MSRTMTQDAIDHERRVEIERSRAMKEGMFFGAIWLAIFEAAAYRLWTMFT